MGHGRVIFKYWRFKFANRFRVIKLDISCERRVMLMCPANVWEQIQSQYQHFWTLSNTQTRNKLHILGSQLFVCMMTTSHWKNFFILPMFLRFLYVHFFQIRNQWIFQQKMESFVVLRFIYIRAKAIFFFDLCRCPM